MAAHSATGEMYEQLIAISEMLFAGEQYEAAYHALMAALYCANDLRDDQRLAAVAQLATTPVFDTAMGSGFDALHLRQVA